MNLSARLKRLEQETAEKESQPVYLWANSPDEVGAVADEYRAENLGNQSRLVIFRWLELSWPQRPRAAKAAIRAHG